MSGGTVVSGRSHAAAGAELRFKKARKIALLLGLDDDALAGLRVLEIGCGAGFIAHWFSGKGCVVTAVDVVDQRAVSEGFEFLRVPGCELPFSDGAFDLVISNHVIEHVGGPEEQAVHLSEVSRVLAPGGTAYLAVPNKWMLVEPHYRLPFLSWLPQRGADLYLRMLGRGSWYDCRPLSRPALEALLANAGLTGSQQHKQALKVLVQVEMPASRLIGYLVDHVPAAVFSAVAAAFPTLIYTLRRRQFRD